MVTSGQSDSIINKSAVQNHSHISSFSLNEKCLRVFWGKNPEKDNQQNNDKTEGAHGLEETEKRNQMTILRFQKRWEWVLGGGGWGWGGGGRRGIRHPRPPFGDFLSCEWVAGNRIAL